MKRKFDHKHITYTRLYASGLIQWILWKKHENGECVMCWKRGGVGGGGGADTHWETCELMDKGRREKRQKIIKLNG